MHGTLSSQSPPHVQYLTSYTMSETSSRHLILIIPSPGGPPDPPHWSSPPHCASRKAGASCYQSLYESIQFLRRNMCHKVHTVPSNMVCHRSQKHRSRTEDKVVCGNRRTMKAIQDTIICTPHCVFDGTLCTA